MLTVERLWLRSVQVVRHINQVAIATSTARYGKYRCWASKLEIQCPYTYSIYILNVIVSSYIRGVYDFINLSSDIPY